MGTYTGPSGGASQGQEVAGSGISQIAGELADLSRAIAIETLEAEKEMAPAKAEKSIAQKGA